MAKLKWYSFRWRIAALVLVIILMFAGHTGYRLYRVTRKLPTGFGPAGPAVALIDFENIWTEQKVVLIGIGDSITCGLGAPDNHNYFQLLQNNDDAEYPDMIGRDLANVIPNLTAFNYSTNYSTTRDHIEKQIPNLRTWPDEVRGIVVITSGGNDLIHNYGRTEPRDGALYGCSYKQAQIWTDNIIQRLKVILESVMQNFPGGCDIFLANIYDPTDGVGDAYVAGFPRWSKGSKIVKLTNSKIEKLCSSYENVHLIDIHTEFLGHGVHCTEFWRKHYRKDDPSYWYFSNFEDPNPRGYDAIRRLFLLKIADVFNENQSKYNGDN